MSNTNQTIRPTVDRRLGPSEYLTDVISEETIKLWKRSHKILITANTGSGKTYFVLHRLYAMLKAALSSSKPRSMLFLTNRIVLREQLIVLYGDEVKDVVTFMNYQSLIQYLKFRKDKIDGQYDLIVADECHWFFTDSAFANGTDLPLNYLINECEQSSVLFLSATSRLLEDYFQQNYADKLNFRYRVMKPYTFSRYFYWNDLDVIKKFLSELPSGEKVLFFCKSIQRALELHGTFPHTSSFVCSPNNKNFGNQCDLEVLEQLRTSEKFDRQILFTTTIIENGVNIHDPALKHIVVDLYDFDSIIQCLGRKRLGRGEEPPSVYVRQVTQSAVSTVINNINYRTKPLEAFKTMSNEKFCQSFGDCDLHGLLYTKSIDNELNICEYVINAAKEFKYQHDLDAAYEINKLDTKFGHLKLLCKYMQIKFGDFEDLGTYYTAISLQDKLNLYLDVPLYSEAKSAFVQLLQKEVLKPLRGGYKVDTVNKYFQNIGLPYSIVAKKQNSKKKPHYGKNGWLLRMEPP